MGMMKLVLLFVTIVPIIGVPVNVTKELATIKAAVAQLNSELDQLRQNHNQQEVWAFHENVKQILHVNINRSISWCVMNFTFFYSDNTLYFPMYNDPNMIKYDKF